VQIEPDEAVLLLPGPLVEPRQIGGRPGMSLWYGLALLLILGLAQMYWFVPAGKTSRVP